MTSTLIWAITAILGTSFLVCAVLVLTQRWHGRLSLDSDLGGIQKLHATPVPRVGGLGLIISLLIGIAVGHQLQGQTYQTAVLLLLAALPDDVVRERLQAAERPALTRHTITEVDALAHAASQRLATQPWPLDVAVLGMGEDGHTASLFPGAAGLAQALHASGPVAWTRPLNAPHARLTLTLPALLATRELVLPLLGPAKLRVYQQARLHADDHLPISLLLHQHQAHQRLHAIDVNAAGCGRVLVIQ